MSEGGQNCQKGVQTHQNDAPELEAKSWKLKASHE
jgi:hypothetical protein